MAASHGVTAPATPRRRRGRAGSQAASTPASPRSPRSPANLPPPPAPTSTTLTVDVAEPVASVDTDTHAPACDVPAGYTVALHRLDVEWIPALTLAPQRALVGISAAAPADFGQALDRAVRGDFAGAPQRRRLTTVAAQRTAPAHPMAWVVYETTSDNADVFATARLTFVWGWTKEPAPANQGGVL